MIACAELLKNITLEAPVESGYTVLKNVFDSGADIVAAMSIRRDK
jgi:CxxC motif-containing protein